MRITFAKIIQKAREWRKLHFRLLPVATCKEYTFRWKLQYKIVKPKEEVTVTPVYYAGEPKREDVKGLLNERYIAILPNVDIIGSSNVVIGKDSFIYDLLANKKKTYNITDRGLFRILNSPVRIGKDYVLCYFNKGNAIDKGLCFVGNFSGNYYHFIYEILIKWYLIEQLEIPKDIPVLIDASARNIPQFKELLSLFSRKREIVYLEKNELRHVSSLYYPSLVNIIPPNLKKLEYMKTEDVVFDKDAILYLRERFLSYIDDNTQATPKRFFISRKSTKWRQYNEEDVIMVVKDLGYEVVYPETMTAREQFLLFNNAEDIVAASGAALSNIICCRPKTRINVLMSVRFDGAIFSTLAKVLNLELVYLVGKVTNYNNVQSDFNIDCAELKKLLIR